jgi:two-component system response regulator QseB
MRILLIEDDAMVGKAMRQGLQKAGMSVDWVTNGRAAILALANGVYEVAVLDLGLPGQDGMEVLKHLRSSGSEIPVIIASARDTGRDAVQGLEAGADDYISKPFDLDELVARVRVQLRRRSGSGAPLLTVGSLTLDPSGRRVTQGDCEVALSAREFALLETLMRKPAEVLSRERLEDSVYGWGEEIASNAIEVHLHHLRKKLGAGTIRNVRGVGYRMGMSE